MQFLNNSHHTDTVRLKFESYHLSHIPKATHSKICSHYKTLTLSPLYPVSHHLAESHSPPTHRQVYPPTCLSAPRVTGTITGPTFPSHADPQPHLCHTRLPHTSYLESLRVYITLTAPPSWCPHQLSTVSYTYRSLIIMLNWNSLGPLLCYIFLQFPKTEVILTFLGFPGHLPSE